MWLLLQAVYVLNDQILPFGSKLHSFVFERGYYSRVDFDGTTSVDENVNSSLENISTHSVFLVESSGFLFNALTLSNDMENIPSKVTILQGF